MAGTLRTLLPILGAMIAVAACNEVATSKQAGGSDADGLVGAWRSRISVSRGALLEMKELEFMYVFNAGGTMTESSNYDSAPPGPPAYGVWRKTSARTFEARYTFYVTKPPTALEEITAGGGWAPNGYGVLSEKITVADDGQSFASTMDYALFDNNGKPVEGDGEATGAGKRMGF